MNAMDMLLEFAGAADAFRLELIKKGWSAEGAEGVASAWLIAVVGS